MALAITDALLGIEALSRHLEASGWRVKLVGVRSERGLFDVLDEPPHYLEVKGQAIHEVRLRLGGSLFLGNSRSTVSIGPIPVHHSRTLPMQFHWLVPVDPAGRLEDFEARLSTRRGGLLWLGEVAQAAWKGGALAQVLNLDPERVLAGARCLRLTEHLLVRPDADLACVRIIHQAKVTARVSLLSSEVLSAERHLPERALLETLEWMAGHIQRLGKPARRAPRPKRAPAKKGRARAKKPA